MLRVSLVQFSKVKVENFNLRFYWAIVTVLLKAIPLSIVIIFTDFRSNCFAKQKGSLILICYLDLHSYILLIDFWTSYHENLPSLKHKWKFYLTSDITKIIYYKGNKTFCLTVYFFATAVVFQQKHKSCDGLDCNQPFLIGNFYRLLIRSPNIIYEERFWSEEALFGKVFFL